MAEKKIRALLIIEILGRPPEVLKKALEDHIGKMDGTIDLKVVSKKFVEPRLVDEEKRIYTCFAEVEVEVGTLFRLSELIFDFMPSSIEVLEPSTVSFNLQEASMFLNDLSGRLHKYDEVAKVAQMRHKQLMTAYENLQSQIAEKSKGSKKKTKTE